MREALVNYAELSVLTNRPVRTLRTLKQAGKIPYLRLGHRMILFQPSKVFAALERFEVKAATDQRPMTCQLPPSVELHRQAAAAAQHTNER
jgi:hypothetical protein